MGSLISDMHWIFPLNLSRIEFIKTRLSTEHNDVFSSKYLG